MSRFHVVRWFMDCSCVLVSGMKSKPRLVTSAIIKAEPSFKANCILLNRAGVNSATELEFIANSNSKSGIEFELPSLELNLNCHHWNWNWIGIAIIGIRIELELNWNWIGIAIIGIGIWVGIAFYRIVFGIAPSMALKSDMMSLV